MTTYVDLARWALRVVDRQRADARAEHPEMTDEEFLKWYAEESERSRSMPSRSPSDKDSTP
jgi:cytochrome c oxidase assembly factor CtaG